MGNFVWPLLVRQPCNIRVNSQVDIRWNNNVGAERICKQLGYKTGKRGPRNANPGGSGPVHALSHVSHVLSRCPHTIDQGVICSGGLGPQTTTTSTSTTATVIGDKLIKSTSRFTVPSIHTSIHWWIPFMLGQSVF